MTINITSRKCEGYIFFLVKHSLIVMAHFKIEDCNGIGSVENGSSSFVPKHFKNISFQQ